MRRSAKPIRTVQVSQGRLRLERNSDNVMVSYHLKSGNVGSNPAPKKVVLAFFYLQIYLKML